MSDFVLVHGAWQTSSAWEDVESGLRDAGHGAWAVPLIGCAAEQVTRADITVTSMAAHLAGDVKDQDRGALVLVGHAEAAPIVQLAAAALSDRVRRVVIVGGPLLESGESIASVNPARYAVPAALGAQDPNRAAMLPEPVWRTDFAGNAPDTSWNGRFRSLACPVGWLSDRPDLDPFWELYRLGVLPVSYVVLADDPYAALYEDMARERLLDPVTATARGPLAAPCTHPGPVADALVTASRW